MLEILSSIVSTTTLSSSACSSTVIPSGGFERILESEIEPCWGQNTTLEVNVQSSQPAIDVLVPLDVGQCNMRLEDFEFVGVIQRFEPLPRQQEICRGRDL